MKKKTKKGNLSSNINSDTSCQLKTDFITFLYVLCSWGNRNLQKSFLLQSMLVLGDLYRHFGTLFSHTLPPTPAEGL
jgi:hypothetical protein